MAAAIPDLLRQKRCIPRPARPRSRWASTLARKPARGCSTRPKQTVTGHLRIYPRLSPDSKAGASPSGRKRKLESRSYPHQPVPSTPRQPPARRSASGRRHASAKGEPAEQTALCQRQGAPAERAALRQRQGAPADWPAREVGPRGQCTRSVRAGRSPQVVHEKVVGDLARLAAEEHRALVQEVDRIRQSKGTVHVLLDDEQRGS
jgi:hypothetical protein